MPWQKKRASQSEAEEPPPPVICSEGDATCVWEAERACSAGVERACASIPKPAGNDLATPPAEGEWIIDRANLLSPEAKVLLFRNLTSFNKTSQLQCYLAVVNEMPAAAEGKTLAPRDVGKKMLRDWFGRGEKVVLIVLMLPIKRMEVAMGHRAKRKLKDTQARRIARKVQPKLGDALDLSAQVAVKEIIKQLQQEKGFVGSLRSILMPIVIVLVLVFMYFKNQTQRGPMGMGGMGMGGSGDFGGFDGMGMGGGVPGMPGMMGAMGSGGMPGFADGPMGRTGGMGGMGPGGVRGRPMGGGLTGGMDGMDSMHVVGGGMAEARARRGLGRGGDHLPDDDFTFAGDRYGRMGQGSAARQRGAIPSDAGSRRVEED
jgi:hypothetical protein